MNDKIAHKLGNDLVDLYIMLYKDEYKTDPVVNKYTEHFNFMTVIDHMGFAKVKASLEYYFKTPRRGHSITAFFNNYHELIVNMERAEEEKARKARIRQETKRRVEQYEQSNRTTSD